MKLIKGAIYTVSGSSLFLKILSIQYSNNEYTKLKICFLNKKNLKIIHVLNIKVTNDRINHWKLMREKDFWFS